MLPHTMPQCYQHAGATILGACSFNLVQVGLLLCAGLGACVDLAAEEVKVVCSQMAWLADMLADRTFGWCRCAHGGLPSLDLVGWCLAVG